MIGSFGRVSIPSCSYHLLDSLVPPSTEYDKSIQGTLLRLENISACAIVKSERNCQILSKTPRPLHKTLWNAYLTEKYFSNDNSKYGSTYNLDELPELMYHWPYEEFNLKESMPSLLPRLEYFSTHWDNQFFGNQFGKCPYYINKINLLEFYTKVSNAIAKTFTNSKGIKSEKHTNYCQVRKINISGGFFTFSLDHITESLEIDKPFLKNSFDKLEVELDVFVPAGENRHGLLRGIEYDIHELAHWYSNSSKSVVLKFHHVSINGCYKKSELKSLVERLVNNGTESLRFGANGNIIIDDDQMLDFFDVSQILEEVFKDNETKSNILTLELYDCVSSLNLLQYLRNLIHLDLTNCYLHGRLDGLKEMHRGLLYLNLQNCRLRNMDLNHLLESPHNSTLKELNLSRNSLSYDVDKDNLIKLFHNVKNILVLDLDTCGLASWNGNDLSLLFNSFKILPNIITLNLHGNQFSQSNLSNLTKVLKENNSLRYLKLSLPADFLTGEAHNTPDRIKTFCSEINIKMNDMHSEFVYIEFTI